jgi:hypothetical protein
MPSGEDARDALIVQGEAVEFPQPIEASLITEDEGRFYRRVDCPWYSPSVLVFPREAEADVADFLPGQYIEMVAAGREYVVYNCTRLVEDALADDAEVVRFSSGRVLSIERYAFRDDRVPALGAFKLADDARGPLLLTEAAVDRINRLGLSGLTFKPIWESARA